MPAEKIEAIVTSMIRDSHELLSEPGRVAAVELPPREIGPLLIEWVAAKAEANAHFDRWSRIGSSYDESAERRAEWGPICDRITKVERSLLTYARTFAATSKSGRLPETQPAPPEAE